MRLIKLLLDLGPLLIFFGTWKLAGDGNGQGWLYDWLPASLAARHNPFFPATAAFMAATIASLAAGLALFRKLEIMPLITAVMVMALGGLTLYMADETFLKMKPTFVYLLFAGILGAGMMTGRPFLKMLMGEAFELSGEGWRILTWRWVWFFLFLALLNEFVWRNFSTGLWIKIKVFGFLPLTMAFAIAQIGLLQRHEEKGDAGKDRAE